SIGLPGMNGFAGEFLVLIGMFQRGYAEAPEVYSAQWLAIAIAAVSGVVLGAWYMLWLVERVFFRKLREPVHHEHDAPIRDMSLREVAALAPQLVLQPMSQDLDQILNITAEPLAKLYSPSVVRPVARRAEGVGPLVVI